MLEKEEEKQEKKLEKGEEVKEEKKQEEIETKQEEEEVKEKEEQEEKEMIILPSDVWPERKSLVMFMRCFGLIYIRDTVTTILSRPTVCHFQFSILFL